MSNRERYESVFTTSFQVGREMLNEFLVYQSVPAWDSVGHMGMIAALEETFNIMMDTQDIIDFSSYSKGIEILARYGVVI